MSEGRFNLLKPTLIFLNEKIIPVVINQQVIKDIILR